MTAKEFLSQAIDIERQINADLLEIQRIRSLAEKTTSTLSSDRVDSGACGGRVEDCAILLAELEESVERNKFMIDFVKHDIRTEIEKLNNIDESSILKLRHLNGMSWYFICAVLDCSRSTANRIHDRAIENLENILQSNAAQTLDMVHQ